MFQTLCPLWTILIAFFNVYINECYATFSVGHGGGNAAMMGQIET